MIAPTTLFQPFVANFLYKGSFTFGEKSPNNISMPFPKRAAMSKSTEGN